MDSHQQKVARIAGDVRRRAPGKGHASLRKEAVSHFVPDPDDPRKRGGKIDVRSLRDVLSIDARARRCVAEPGVTFAELVRRTLPLGLVPKLVPELKTITLGGAIAGCSVESMSYRYGGFHDSCQRYELVTGTGEVVGCSRTENPLLFGMLHGSYGTLGILTSIEFDLVPAKPFVHLEYQRFADFDTFHSAMRRRCELADVDFIDAIIHGPRVFVLCLGRFVDRAPYVSDYSWMRIFYKSTNERRHDYLTTYDYFFRYDAECHWLTRTIPGMESAPVRLLLGRTLLGSTNLLRWADRLGRASERIVRPNVVVDVFVPAERFAEFWHWYESAPAFFPMWVVPYRAPERYPWIAAAHAARAPGDMYVDCAVYGLPNDVPGVDWYRILEDKTRELGGIKTLISRNLYDRDTFWSIYNRDNYTAAKRQTDPNDLFGDMYEKLHHHVSHNAARSGPTTEPRVPESSVLQDRTA